MSHPAPPTYLCMACGLPVRGDYVETRSGLRRHMACPTVDSYWDDPRIARLWRDIQAAPPLDVAPDPWDAA